MDKKDAVRIQNSLLSKAEKKLLIQIAQKLPKWVTSDQLTWLGFWGAVVSGLGYYLSNWGENFLWLSSFGLLVNWFGDSLDGTLARVRKTQRPIYGFFIDHNIDALTIIIMCVGAGVSPYISLPAALILLVGYLLISIHTYINTYLNGEFKISYSKFGPTEMRLVAIIVNTLFIYLPPKNPSITVMGASLKFFDLFALGIAFVIYILYFSGFFSAKKKYKKMDPVSPHN